MLTVRDRAPRNRRRLLPLTVLIAAAVALLAFAGTAAAETKVGEGSAAVNPAIPAEADIVKATASYDSTGGAVNFTVTTVAEPHPGTEADPSELGLIADLLTTSLPCTESLLSTEAVFPLLGISAPYRADEEAEAGITESLSGGSGEITLEPVTRSVTGVTTALSVTSSLAAGRAFNCAAIAATDEGSPTNWLFFPISVAVVPVAPVVTTTAPPAPAAAPPAPAPAPAALSIAKSKPLKLKAGKSRTVKIKVTNTGGTATGLGSLRVKAPAGVLVKPETQKVPVLPPGSSWTLSVRVQLTAKAKKQSTISLTGTAPGLSAKGSFVVKLLG
jgi:NPCBM-associated, NEW3 domain of alpha-galactosidase